MDTLLIVVTALSLVLSVVFAAVAMRIARDDRRRSEARVAALAGAIEGTPLTVAAPAGAVAASTPLFDGTRQESHSSPLLKFGVAAILSVVAIVLLAMGTGGEPTSTGPAATQASQQPLELVSMRHARSGDTLTVTGLVRNSGGAEARGITAVVFAFDPGGSFLASGRAPLEFARLGAGDESPFQVTVPNVTDIERYRVSFRTEDGIVRHVDRR
jgi:hypothetical protein